MLILNRIVLILLFIALVLASGFKGFQFYQESVSRAVQTAVTSQKSIHSKKISNLKSRHKKHVKELKQKHLKIRNKLRKEHQKEVAKVKTKERAKAKVQRAVSAVPILGTAAFAIFEKIEFDNWKKENPDGTVEEYTIELGASVESVLKDEYKEYYEEYQDFIEMIDAN